MKKGLKPKENKNSVHGVSLKIFFAVMFFVVNSVNYSVQKSGKNTRFYDKVIDVVDLNCKVKDNTLYDIIRKVATHYYSKQRPYFYLVLSIQCLWWTLEQFCSLIIPEETLKLMRRFILEILDRMEEILREDDLNKGIEQADKLKNYLNCFSSGKLKDVNELCLRS